MAGSHSPLFSSGNPFSPFERNGRRALPGKAAALPGREKRPGRRQLPTGNPPAARPNPQRFTSACPHRRAQPHAGPIPGGWVADGTVGRKLGCGCGLAEFHPDGMVLRQAFKGIGIGGFHLFPVDHQAGNHIALVGCKGDGDIPPLPDGEFPRVPAGLAAFSHIQGDDIPLILVAVVGIIGIVGDAGDKLPLGLVALNRAVDLAAAFHGDGAVVLDCPLVVESRGLPHLDLPACRIVQGGVLGRNGPCCILSQANGAVVCQDAFVILALGHGDGHPVERHR